MPCAGGPRCVRKKKTNKIGPKKTQKTRKNADTVANPVVFYGFLTCEYLVLGGNEMAVTELPVGLSTRVRALEAWALSTSFEKTCMRQIHCTDRLTALVNKGPYHAQGLFSNNTDSLSGQRTRVCVSGRGERRPRGFVRSTQAGRERKKKKTQRFFFFWGGCSGGKSIRTEARTRDLSRVRRAS